MQKHTQIIPTLSYYVWKYQRPIGFMATFKYWHTPNTTHSYTLNVVAPDTVGIKFFSPRGMVSSGMAAQVLFPDLRLRKMLSIESEIMSRWGKVNWLPLNVE